ncbi:alkaline phosphatase [Serratia sp. B1]|nr:alkaline phosphatase [Serratia sp. B1]
MFRLTLATRLALSMSLLATGAAAAKATDNAPLTQREDPYFLQAQAQLQQRLKQTPNTNRAKNVILVVGDGMGFSTVTAARIFEGQQRGVDGESNVLAWEAFPIWRQPKPIPPTPKSPTPRPARWR